MKSKFDTTILTSRTSWASTYYKDFQKGQHFFGFLKNQSPLILTLYLHFKPRFSSFFLNFIDLETILMCSTEHKPGHHLCHLSEHYHVCLREEMDGLWLRRIYISLLTGRAVISPMNNLLNRENVQVKYGPLCPKFQVVAAYSSRVLRAYGPGWAGLRRWFITRELDHDPFCAQQSTVLFLSLWGFVL
jgi:hypothetical protein